jgi:hypothetical protein
MAMTDKITLIGSRLWLQWVWLTAIGYSVGYFGGFILGHFLLGNVMIGVFTGAGVGFMQSFNLLAS